MEREIAFANVRDYVNGTNMELEYLQNTLFYPSDIDPGNEYYGIIISEFGKSSDSAMRLSFSFADVPFRFSFEKQQIKYGNY
jgi:predicted peptidase